MTMRRLLELLLQEFTHPSIRPTKYDGLCTAVYAMKREGKINDMQASMLFTLIQNRLNNKFITYSPKSFDGDIEMNITTTGVFLYKPYLIKPRVRWLKKLIKQYTNQYTGY